MKKLIFKSRISLAVTSVILLLLTLVLGHYLLGNGVMFSGDKLVESCSNRREPHVHWAFLHGSLATVYGIVTFFIIAYHVYYICAFDEIKNSYAFNNNNDDEQIDVKFSFKKVIIWFVVLISIFQLIRLSMYSVKQSKVVYNASIVYKSNYEKTTQELTGFYDKMWKTRSEKLDIANMNKDIFVQVSRIIMENKADSKNLVLKFVTEQKLVPYEEFSTFYKDLSEYVESQREAYYKIELRRQDIANANNILLDTFPNNQYNKLLEIKKIEYKYGFTSDKTKQVFESGLEN